jgi:hypothetical protein
LFVQIANGQMKHQFLLWLTLLASSALSANDPLAFASGSWFDPERDGEGFVVQLIPEERALVTWFTYPPEGETGEQAWLIGSGVTVGNRIVITEMQRPVGATFGPDFDPASGSYREMPQLPESRHHPMMTTDGHDIYLAGGYRSKIGLENPRNNLWRFDPEMGEWEILPDLPRVRAAGAAVYMHSRIWILGGVGVGTEMQSYDIRTGQWKLFPGASVTFRNHIQAVAFENEIWWIAGRTDGADRTTNEVQIWNPVTREWREGPPLNHARAGFAAKVVRGQIMVTGGEVLDFMPGQLALSLEVFAPGAEYWVLGQAPTVAVHGITGAVVNGEFVLTAGSDIAGELSLNRATQILTPAIPANPAGSFDPSGKTELSN